MEFSRQEYWSELLCPTPGDLPNSGMELWSPALQTDALLFEPLGEATGKTIALTRQTFVGKVMSLLS